MNLRAFLKLAVAAMAVPIFSPLARATAVYQYKPDEFLEIDGGLSPNGQYSIRAHGEGEIGADNFHLYLFDAKSGRRIGPLEEVKDNLDTDPGTIGAKWSNDSHFVSITYRIDRREFAEVRYRIEKGRAYCIKNTLKKKH
jgi:hypothetical protein